MKAAGFACDVLWVFIAATHISSPPPPYLHRNDAFGLVAVRFGMILLIQRPEIGVDLVGEAGLMQGVEVKAEIIQHKLQFHGDGVGQGLNGWRSA